MHATFGVLYYAHTLSSPLVPLPLGRSFLPAVASCIRISVGKHADTLSHRVNVWQQSRLPPAEPQWKVKMSGMRKPQQQHRRATNTTPNLLKKKKGTKRKKEIKGASGLTLKSSFAGASLSLHSSVFAAPSFWSDWNAKSPLSLSLFHSLYILFFSLFRSVWCLSHWFPFLFPSQALSCVFFILLLETADCLDRQRERKREGGGASESSKGKCKPGHTQPLSVWMNIVHTWLVFLPLLLYSPFPPSLSLYLSASQTPLLHSSLAFHSSPHPHSLAAAAFIHVQTTRLTDMVCSLSLSHPITLSLSLFFFRM